MQMQLGLNRRLTPYIFAAPAVLVMLFGLLYPVVEALRLSFYEVRLGEQTSPQAFRGLAIFAEALSDSSVLKSMAVTLEFSVVVVVVEIVLGVGLALILEKPLRGMMVFRTLLVLPMMIAPICVGLIWRYMFDVNVGPINGLLGNFGLKPAWLAEPGLAFFAICITDIWQFTPFVFILALAGLQGLDQSSVEAAKMDGASVFQIIRYVKLPLLAPILMITILMRVIDALRGLEVVYAMTNGGPGLSTELFSLHIYKSAFVTQRMGHSAALSVCLLVVTTALSVLLLAWSNPLRQRTR
jgi:multiple sugar transport system permease protein